MKKGLMALILIFVFILIFLFLFLLFSYQKNNNLKISALNTLNVSYCNNLVYTPLDKFDCKNVGHIGLFDYLFRGCDRTSCELVMKRKCYKSVSDDIEVINQPIFDLAMSSKNYSYCDKLINIKHFCDYGCYAGPATMIGSVECLVQDTEQEKCYLAVAKLTNNLTICSKGIIRDRDALVSSYGSPAREKCFTYMTQVFNDPNLCTNISFSSGQSRCIMAFNKSKFT